MVAFRILLWPLLLVGAGLVWILFVGMTGYLIPVLNTLILQGMVSQQTMDACAFQLRILSMMPGIIPAGFGAGLLAQSVYTGSPGRQE